MTMDALKGPVEPVKPEGIARADREFAAFLKEEVRRSDASDEQLEDLGYQEFPEIGEEPSVRERAEAAEAAESLARQAVAHETESEPQPEAAKPQPAKVIKFRDRRKDSSWRGKHAKDMAQGLGKKTPPEWEEI